MFICYLYSESDTSILSKLVESALNTVKSTPEKTKKYDCEEDFSSSSYFSCTKGWTYISYWDFCHTYWEGENAKKHSISQ